MSVSVWLLVVIALALLVVVVFTLLWRSARKQAADDLPTEWPLVQRPLFSPEERTLYRQLRAALPHHMILAKVPLVRFCQPVDRNDVRYWFGLLGPIHVSFIICADNGRVLAALDIKRPDFKPSRRTTVIKQAVLTACRIRYIECRSDQLPSTSDLQGIVPQQGETAARTYVPGSGPQTHASPPDRSAASGASSGHAGAPQQGSNGRSTLAHAVRTPRNGTPWYESGFSQDSFFAPDLRDQSFPETDPNAGLSSSNSRFPSFAAGNNADLQSHRQWPPQTSTGGPPSVPPPAPDGFGSPPPAFRRR
jgi:nitrogen fixation-related uncharacterized protein